MSKIDYASFRRNFSSLMQKEEMKQERKKLMLKEAQKVKYKELKANSEAINKQQNLMQRFIN